jgi:putative RNA 2'-phosphotransferase
MKGAKMLKHQHKTLARTLQYIGWHSPSEYGLFWDSDGTMPWKEFYWVLQEDPTLRFVREAGLRELSLLGIELPFVLDGNLLRLSPGIAHPQYPVADSVPESLFYAIKPKNLVSVQNIGLKATGRRFMPLCTDSALALRIAKRRESEPILIEILARQALDGGVSFVVSGPELYLAEAISPSFLLIPKIRRELEERLLGQRAPKPAQKPAEPPSPGSFIVQPQHMNLPGTGGPGAKKAGKKGKGGWKKDSRSERHKREI